MFSVHTLILVSSVIVILTSSAIAQNDPKILALGLRKTIKGYLSISEEHGDIHALVGTEIPLYVYGSGLTNDTQVVFTSGKTNQDCGGAGHNIFKSNPYLITTEHFGSDADSTETKILTIPGDELPFVSGHETFYVCLKINNDTYQHQGTDYGLRITLSESLLPLWLAVIFMIILFCLSGLFSGLNLGLMSLDNTELQIIMKTGSKNERKYASKIAPIRKTGNFLLCSLLLGNVLVNNSLTLLLDSLTSGAVAIVGATMGIVIFGEIIPQAVCSRNGLAVGAYTIWITKFFMLATGILAWPISIILDKVLGRELGKSYTRQQLIELIKQERIEMKDEEIEMMRGALIFKEKTVKEVMTPLEDCYMLPLDTVLNFETLTKILEFGHSRIPVYDGNRTNIVHVLMAKDLMIIDPDDELVLATVCEFYDYGVNFEKEGTSLDLLLKEFISGDISHLAMVKNADGTTIGLVTLEDIIEEILKREIVDETDDKIDNVSKKKNRKNIKRLEKIKKRKELQEMFDRDPPKIEISPTLITAIFQYLRTSVEPFKEISETNLNRILSRDIYIKISAEDVTTEQDNHIIIEEGKPIDFFILIIEGKVDVKIGKEGLTFESGPFNYFGLETLKKIPSLTQDRKSMELKETPSKATPGFVPDYTVKAKEEVLYLKIKNFTYFTATSMAKRGISLQSGGGNDDDNEEEKLLKPNEMNSTLE